MGLFQNLCLKLDSGSSDFKLLVLSRFKNLKNLKTFRNIKVKEAAGSGSPGLSPVSWIPLVALQNLQTRQLAGLLSRSEEVEEVWFPVWRWEDVETVAALSAAGATPPPDWLELKFCRADC